MLHLHGYILVIDSVTTWPTWSPLCKNAQGPTVAEAVSCLLLYHGGPSSFSGDGMWDLWWVGGHEDRILSSYFCFPCHYHWNNVPYWSFRHPSVAFYKITLKADDKLFKFLNPTGHVMHQQFNIQQLYALPTLYLCVLYLSENKQRLVPLTV